MDACHAQGRCALAVAVQNCACRTVERLLAAGADLTVADMVGRTALHYAAQKGALHVPCCCGTGHPGEGSCSIGGVFVAPTPLLRLHPAAPAEWQMMWLERRLL